MFDQTIVFFALYFGYKFIRGTRLQTLADFKDEYFPREFTGARTEMTARQELQIGHMLKEIWSLAK